MVFLTRTKITIDLTPGFYSLGFDSGTGKSYLKYLLEQISKSGLSEYKVLVVDCSDVRLDYLKEELKRNWDLVFIDRFDLNPDKDLNNLMLQYCMDSINLISCKDLNLFYGKVLEIVDIEYNEDEIIISD